MPRRARPFLYRRKERAERFAFKGGFRFPLWIVGIKISSQSLSSEASPIERQVIIKFYNLHTDNSVSAPASVGASKHSLRGCHRQPAPPQRQGFHPWPTAIRGSQYSFLDKRKLKQSVEKPVFTTVCGGQPHFCFSADMCGRKTHYKRKPLIWRFSRARGWYWREWSAVRKSKNFRRTAFPPRERRLCRHSKNSPKGQFFGTYFAVSISSFNFSIQFLQTI